MTNSSETNNKHNFPPPSKFNKLLDYIWPIERSELPKFLFITLLMFCILFIQNLIRALKDGLVTTLIGTETISYLKFWGVVPTAFLFTIVYVKLVNNLKSENIFYLITSVFLIFFFLFAFFLFPNHENIHLNSDYSQNLVQSYPHLKWFILLISKWSFSLFYVIAELWPNIMFAMLFWQFVNNVTSVEESKRFYPLFGLLGQTGLYFSGQFLTNLVSINQYFRNHFNLINSESSLSTQIILSLVIILGLIAVVTFWMLNNKILDKAHIENLQFKAKKQTMTLVESFKLIVFSRYIRLIATLLFCYGMAINLVEAPWKAAAAQVYKTPTEYVAFVGNYLSYTGILTLIFVIIGSNIVRKLGWFTAAIITPIMVFVTGLLFFIVNNFEGVSSFALIGFIVADPALIAVTIGAIQNVLSKSSKYTLFDSTKEMSYVPLDKELKVKGKAAADVLGIKMGKSTSAFLQHIIFIIFPAATYQSTSVSLMLIFIVICIIWIWSTKELGKEYNKEVLEGR